MAVDAVPTSIHALTARVQRKMNPTPTSSKFVLILNSSFGKFTDISDCKGANSKKPQTTRPRAESTENNYPNGGVPNILVMQDLSVIAKYENSIVVNVTEENNVILKVYQPPEIPTPLRNTASNA